MSRHSDPNARRPLFRYLVTHPVHGGGARVWATDPGHALVVARRSIPSLRDVACGVQQITPEGD